MSDLTNVPAIPIHRSPYGYTPSRPVAIVFLSLFGVSTALHLVQSIRYRRYFMIATAVFCGLIELMGWSARLWSSFNEGHEVPFQIQITGTIIAPTPLLAATFIIFGQMIQRLGVVYSRLSSKWYTIIFLSCDIVSLVVQGAGGGLAASAVDQAGADLGGNIMLGGIVLQLTIIVGFSILATEFFIRYTRNQPIASRVQSVVKDVVSAGGSAQGVPPRGELTGKLKMMSAALGFSTVVLFIRAIYRTIELVDGWNGRIIMTEVYFNVLDGMMVVLAIYTLNFCHPGVLLAEPLSFLHVDGHGHGQHGHSVVAMEKVKWNAESESSQALV